MLWPMIAAHWGLSGFQFSTCDVIRHRASTVVTVFPSAGKSCQPPLGIPFFWLMLDISTKNNNLTHYVVITTMTILHVESGHYVYAVALLFCRWCLRTADPQHFGQKHRLGTYPATSSRWNRTSASRNPRLQPRLLSKERAPRHGAPNPHGAPVQVNPLFCPEWHLGGLVDGWIG